MAKTLKTLFKPAIVGTCPHGNCEKRITTIRASDKCGWLIGCAKHTKKAWYDWYLSSLFLSAKSTLHDLQHLSTKNYSRDSFIECMQALKSQISGFDEALMSQPIKPLEDEFSAKQIKIILDHIPTARDDLGSPIRILNWMCNTGTAIFEQANPTYRIAVFENKKR